ncbi:properdin, partial [Biomphalaria pfeifferi]
MVSFAPTQYYLLIVVPEHDWKQLTFNDYNLDDYFQNTEPIAFWGSRNWVQLEFHLDMESKSIRCTRDTFFGCYVYRVGQQVSFSQSLGFLKGYTCENTSMEPGDQIDNDCDFEKDEEIANGLDDDYDNLFDEDLEATYIEAPFEDIILQEIEENPKEQGEFTLRTAYDTFLWITTSAIVLTMLAGMLRLKRSHMAGGQ